MVAEKGVNWSQVMRAACDRKINEMTRETESIER